MRAKVWSGSLMAPATRGPAVAARGVKVKRTGNRDVSYRSYQRYRVNCEMIQLGNS